MEAFRERLFSQAVPLPVECGFDADMGGRREIHLPSSEGRSNKNSSEADGRGP